MIGQRFGRLVVQDRGPNFGTDTAFNCLCDCGGTKRIRRKNLIAGTTRSCGCLYKEIRAISGPAPRLRHGHARKGKLSPTFSVWSGMVRRCISPGATSYRLYGGRGITVCRQWLKFENFLADMGERPAATSLDRINSNGNYEPGNCRWATSDVQAKNKRAWGTDMTPALHSRLMSLPDADRLALCREMLPEGFEIASHLERATALLKGRG